MSTVLDFSRPAKDLIVSIINETLNANLDMADIAAITISESYVDQIPYSTIPDRLRYVTRAVLSIAAPTTMTDVRFRYPDVRIKYFRLSLVTFLYRDVVGVDWTSEAENFSDPYVTTEETAAADALTYLQTTYGVRLEPSDCLVESQPELIDEDGYWPVVITVRKDHPVWIGAVRLAAHSA